MKNHTEISQQCEFDSYTLRNAHLTLPGIPSLMLIINPQCQTFLFNLVTANITVRLIRFIIISDDTSNPIMKSLDTSKFTDHFRSIV
jgi:hypothetical protein